ncbi:hypothetical protein [Novosphingobium sp. AP12]|uniref:winged helix-turn-helix domain-containing protein n=1 Tax=Novosphingobium sp. AP12 TaxID=1144305 RepID=UPI000271DE14|nr:hypothetical protein [Novosphingobium sp. AP12]EJL21918.1 hypothetical protein PMI02_04903 [Novosphingobium sp. AP12]
MTATCPHCSKDISEDAAIERGPWWLHPAGAFLHGDPQPISRQQARVLYAVARANGEPITHHDIPGCGEGTLAHHLRMIRKALGERYPVSTLRGRGFVWAPC